MNQADGNSVSRRSRWSQPERRDFARLASSEALVPAGASIIQIGATYRRLSRATHSDARGTDYGFARLGQSYEKALEIAAGRAWVLSHVQKLDGSIRHPIPNHLPAS